MKNFIKNLLLGVVGVIWICKPVPYETLSYHIHQRENNVSKVFIVERGGGKGTDSSSCFVPFGTSSSQSCNPDPRFPDSLGGEGEGGGSGGSSGSDSPDNSKVPPKTEWKKDPDWWEGYQSDPEKKKKQEELQTCLVPEEEVSLEYEISDSEEIYEKEFDDSDDEQSDSNSMYAGYRSAKDDDYSNFVYKYKYSTSPSRFARFLPRVSYANKKEAELFSKDRTQDDLKSASEINPTDKRLKDKMWRHPDFFGLTKPKSSSKTPKEDFFKQHEKDAKKQLKEHLVSPHTRCFKNGLYRDHQESYDYYYNNQTGKLIIVKTDDKTGERDIFSVWTISKMQRLELLNHNHVHKHWKLVEALQKKEAEEKALVKAKNAQKREENSLNEAVSPVEAARRASESIRKDREANNDIQ